MKIRLKTLFIICLVVIGSLQQQQSSNISSKTDTITVKSDRPVDTLLMNVVKDKIDVNNLLNVCLPFSSEIKSILPAQSAEILFVVSTKGSPEKKFNLKKKTYELSFQIMALNAFIDLNVFWNGILIGNITGMDKFQYNYLVNAQNGSNTLSFSQNKFFKNKQAYISISYIKFQQQQCSGDVKTNLIVNGGFETNTCFQKACIWSKNTYNGNVLSWIPDPQIQIGFMNFYSLAPKNYGYDKWGAELDATTNTCIKQKIKTKPGKYSVQFQYYTSTNKQVALASSKFAVYFNDQILKDYNTPLPYELVKLQVIVNQDQLSMLQFCGGSRSQGVGAVIDNVKMFYVDACQPRQL